jgi:hypothetical protein
MPRRGTGKWTTDSKKNNASMLATNTKHLPLLDCCIDLLSSLFHADLANREVDKAGTSEANYLGGSLNQ